MFDCLVMKEITGTLCSRFGHGRVTAFRQLLVVASR